MTTNKMTDITTNKTTDITTNKMKDIITNKTTGITTNQMTGKHRTSIPSREKTVVATTAGMVTGITTTTARRGGDTTGWLCMTCQAYQAVLTLNLSQFSRHTPPPPLPLPVYYSLPPHVRATLLHTTQ